jgi:Ras-related protein Rab-2A
MKTNLLIFQANGIKIGPSHSPTSPGGISGPGGQGSAQGGSCC